MNAKRIHKPLFTALVIVVLLAALNWINGSSNPANADNVLKLNPPSFLVSAPAAEAAAPSDASFLEDEAGIAAYTQTAGSIDLSVIRDEFRTIERETAEYIVGSVGIPDYSEDHDPHVYVHTDGWVVAYYLVADPASIIIDMRHYDGVQISTMLEKAIEQILSVVGAIPFEEAYYDFRYPNATNLMLIAEARFDAAGTDSFEVKLPSNFVYYERSWTHVFHQTWSGMTSNLYLDGSVISSLPSIGQINTWLYKRGGFTAAQLPPGVFHNIQVDLSATVGNPGVFGGIALVYQEVP